jgi:hypothetical protein
MKPTANITVSRNRIKLYDNKNLFLQNGQEFEFELFNPTQDRIVAKISVDGHNISDNDSGVIINPGQRIWIERYLDKSVKFKFETYTVEAGNAAVEQAISQNGVIRISFHKEIVKKHVPIKMTLNGNNRRYCKGNSNINGIDYAPDVMYRGIADSRTILNDNLTNNTYTSTTLDVQGFNFCDVDYSAATANLDMKSLSKPEEKKTGRINEGNHSNQSFYIVDMQYEIIPFEVVEYHIYPESQKNFITDKDISVYCTNCGKKKTKSSWKHCPACGYKF